jgi:predicted dienelactone hydrolase
MTRYHASRLGFMRPSHATAAALLIGLMVLCVGASPSRQPRPNVPFKVGVTWRSFVPQGAYNWRGAKTRALVTQLWYPAVPTTGTSPQWLGPADSPWFRLGEWAEGAPAAEGRYPLVVLSHGTGGSSTMMGWLAQALAERGYVVAAVNHPGNNALEPYTVEGFLLWWERARDVSTLIDHLMADRELSLRIDSRRIGAGGFSLGGYTVLALAGARTDPQAFQAFCRSRAVGICQDPAEFPGLFARWAEIEQSDPEFQRASRQAGAPYRDARVRAAFALAPALGPALTSESLRQVSIPVAVVAGELDAVADLDSNAKRVSALLGQVRLTLLPDAGHYTFLASCTDRGREARPELCTDAANVNREMMHRRAEELAIEFFGRTLE